MSCCRVYFLATLLCLPAATGTSAQQRSPGTTESDWEVLRALYAATSGDAWVDNENWDASAETSPTAAELDLWHGVTVTDGRVTGIRLPGNGLSGELPAALGNLTRLQYLDLAFNQLTGAIPGAFGRLAGLRVLYLRGNHFSGAIPAELGNLTNLRYLNLRSNELEGALPPELGNLQQLRGMWLHANRLSGAVPSSFEQMSALEILWLKDNLSLSGALPQSMLRLPSLADIRIDGTSLCVPAELDAPNERRMVNDLAARYACLFHTDWEALVELFQATNGEGWISSTHWDVTRRPRASVADVWHGVTVDNGSTAAVQQPRWSAA